MVASDDDQFGVPLRHLEERLGDDVVTIVLPSTGANPIVRALDIYDATGDDIGGEGVLLSLISADAMRPDELKRALRSAAANNCSGIAVKVVGPASGDSALVQLATEAGLATVVLASQVSWREFDALVTRALGENAQSLTLAPSLGDKLFSIANTIARVFGGSVAIEDHQRGILAHSSVQGQAIDELRTTGILFRRAGDAPINERRYREVLEAEGIVRFARYGDSLPRAAIAIRAGTIPLGSIWVLDPGGTDPDHVSLDEGKQRALELGATVAAGALLESWQASSRAGSRRESAFKRVLAGAAQPGDREALDPTGDGVGMILLAAVPPGPRTAGRMAEARTVLARHLAMFIPNVAITAEGNEIIALCPTPLADQVRGWVTAAIAELSQDTLAGLTLGLSDPHVLSTRLPFALSEARELAAQSRVAGELVGTVSRLRTQLFLAACRAQLELDDRLLLPEVRELLDGGERSTQAIRTLECWLAEAGNIARTALRLRVHEQTVRYRLRRLRERVPLDTAGPDYLLTLWAQLRAMR
jgi:hypothetical protein